jgi:hypothetical protein
VVSDEPLFEEDLTDLSDEAQPADAAEATAGDPPAERPRPTPHRSKLVELQNNAKLPESDRERVERAVDHYDEWIAAMTNAEGTGEQKVVNLVAACNEYKRRIELDLIWDSPNAFLFRQRGQLKLDNSIIEEFLPWLIDPIIVPELADTDCLAGPRKAFAAASFETTLLAAGNGAGLRIRTKDQDFALSRRAFLQSSFDSSFPAAQSSTHEIHLAYVATECKTNLDKTMFQEASATAHDLKVALPGAKYYLLAEYLDMRPISTAGTDIDEVLILRGRRMGAQLRQRNSDPEARAETRDSYVEYLDQNPLRTDVVLRFVEHVQALFADVDPDADDVLQRGYF